MKYTPIRRLAKFKNFSTYKNAPQKRKVEMTKIEALKQLYLYAMNTSKTVDQEKYYSMALISALAPDVLKFTGMWTALIIDFCERRPQCFVEYYYDCDELYSDKLKHGNLRRRSNCDGTIVIDMCFFNRGEFDKWQTIAIGQI